MAKANTSRAQSKARTKLAEQIVNESPGKVYAANEIVLATVPGYPCWPARITDIQGQTIHVEFFGTGERCVSLRISQLSFLILFALLLFSEIH